MASLEEMKALAKEIQDFLHMHGKRDASNPNEWNSPDAAHLDIFAKMLSGGGYPAAMPHSEWGSGGYKPYNSDIARQKHDHLLKKCKEMLDSFVPDSLKKVFCSQCGYHGFLREFKLHNGGKRCPVCKKEDV
jgi:Zn ribbon nucleic-acid-binding protein